LPRGQDILSRSSIEVEPDLDLDVSIESDEEHVRLRAKDGKLKVVGGVYQEPDLAIRLRAVTVGDVLSGSVATTEVFRDAELASGDQRRPALPAAETCVAREGQFEPIPGASLSTAIRVTSTIFGDVGVRELWCDGALASSELVPLSELERDEFDIGMWCSLAQLAAIRRRELTPLDALASGVGLRGDWPQLMCFFELVQHPCFAAAWSSRSAIEAQVRWGSVFCSSSYGDAVRAARSEAEAEADGRAGVEVGQ
jgi:hypothetical protein